MRTAVVAALAVLVLVALAAGCDRPAPQRANVFVLLADTLRADRLEPGRAEQPPTAALDSLRQRGAAFANAYSQSSWTTPAVASLFTARYPSAHGADRFRSVLGDDELTFAEILEAAGYRTGGFSANPLIAAASGFAQGFAVFESPATEGTAGAAKVRARELHRRLLAWIDADSDGASPPLFVYLHYMEPHTPYAPEPALLHEIRARRGRGAPDPEELAALFFGDTDWNRLSPAQLTLVEDLYDAEIASLDAALGELFEELGRRGLLDDAIVVFTSDHGEEFLEHGRFGHGRTLYEEVIRVPLLVAAPGAAGVSAEIVSLVDIAPTVLDLLSLPPAASFAGTSFAAALRRPAAPRPVGRALAWLDQRLDSTRAAAVSELLRVPGEADESVVHHRQSIVRGAAKLILSSDGTREAFDLDRDPGERQADGLAPATAEALSRLLADRVSAAPPAAGPERPIDPELRERLRLLGYSE